MGEWVNLLKFYSLVSRRGNLSRRNGALFLTWNKWEFHLKTRRTNQHKDSWNASMNFEDGGVGGRASKRLNYDIFCTHAAAAITWCPDFRYGNEKFSPILIHFPSSLLACRPCSRFQLLSRVSLSNGRTIELIKKRFGEEAVGVAKGCFASTEFGQLGSCTSIECRRSLNPSWGRA